MLLTRIFHPHSPTGSKIEKAVVPLEDWLNKIRLPLKNVSRLQIKLTSQSRFWEFTGVTLLRSVISETLYFQARTNTSRSPCLAVCLTQCSALGRPSGKWEMGGWMGGWKTGWEHALTSHLTRGPQGDSCLVVRRSNLRQNSVSLICCDLRYIMLTLGAFLFKICTVGKTDFLEK